MLEQYVKQLTEKLEVMMRDLADLTPNIIIGLITFTLFIFLAKVIQNFIQNTIGARPSYFYLAKVISRLSYIVVIVLGILVASSIIFPSITPQSLFSLLGVGGVAIGFAFKEIFQNFLAGILILLLRPFQIGDQIEVSGYEGTVEDIEIRATLIRTSDNRRVIIPNSTIFTTNIVVHTAYHTRRVSVNLGIGYQDDIGVAKTTILETLKNVDGIANSPVPKVIVTNYSSSTIDLEIRFWLTSLRRNDAQDVKDAVLEVLRSKLFAAGVDLPYPTQQVLVRETKNLGDLNK